MIQQPSATLQTLRFNLSGLVGTVVLVLIYATTQPWPWELELSLAALLILTTGIPHGATDHLLAKINQRKRGERFVLWRFLLTYLGWMAVAATVWLVAPLAALIIFILGSSYHFGQAQYGPLLKASKNRWAPGLAYLLWGASVLTALLGWNATQTAELLDPITQSEFSVTLLDFILDYYGRSLAIVYGVLAWLALVLLGYKHLDWKLLLSEALVLAALHLAAYSLPLLLGFALFFGLWHAGRSLQHLVLQYRMHLAADYSLRNFYRDAALYSVLAIVGLAVLVLLAGWLQSYLSPILLFFILVSTVTLPHMLHIGKSYTRRP